MEIKINKKGEKEIKFSLCEALDFHFSFALEHHDLTFGEALELFIKEKERKENEGKGISTKNTRPKNRIA